MSCWRRSFDVSFCFSFLSVFSQLVPDGSAMVAAEMAATKNMCITVALALMTCASSVFTVNNYNNNNLSNNSRNTNNNINNLSSISNLSISNNNKMLLLFDTMCNNSNNTSFMAARACTRTGRAATWRFIIRNISDICLITTSASLADRYSHHITVCTGTRSTATIISPSALLRSRKACRDIIPRFRHARHRRLDVFRFVSFCFVVVFGFILFTVLLQAQEMNLETGRGLAKSDLSGKKKALLMGCNYVGTPNQLKGCVQDVQNMKAFIISTFGFTEDPAHMRCRCCCTLCLLGFCSLFERLLTECCLTMIA
jgi:hypothetical protein